MARRKKHYPPLSEHRYRVHELPSNRYLKKAEFNWGSYFPFIGPSGIVYAPKLPVQTVGGPPATFFASRDWATTPWRDVPEDEAEQATMLLNDAMEQGGPALLLTFASGWKCYCEDTAHKIAQYLSMTTMAGSGPLSVAISMAATLPGDSLQRLASLTVVGPRAAERPQNFRPQVAPDVNWSVFEVNNARFEDESWWIPEQEDGEEGEMWTAFAPIDATDAELVGAATDAERGNHYATRATAWAAGWSHEAHHPSYIVRLEDRGEELWIVRDVEWVPDARPEYLAGHGLTKHFTKKQAQAIYRNGSWFRASDIPSPTEPPDWRQLVDSLRASGNADDAKTAEKLYRLSSSDEAWDDALAIAREGFDDMDYFITQSGDGEPLYVLTRTPDREAPDIRDYADTPGEDEDLNR